MLSMIAMNNPANFYTGLVSELYEPLAGGLPDADQYATYVTESGQPALELCCGSGVPMLELVKRGLDVEGLDASADMLAVCRGKAREMGLEVTLHQGLMQSFDLGKRYQSIFVAAGSLTLLTTDEDALACLDCIHRHLMEGGSALIALEVMDIDSVRKGIGRFKEAYTDSGDSIRCGLIAADVSDDGRNFELTLRYEKRAPWGDEFSLERVWQRRCWTPSQFADLIQVAGFSHSTFMLPNGEAADDTATSYMVVVRR